MSETILKIKGKIAPGDVTNFSYESTARSYVLVSLCMLILLYTEIMKTGALLFLLLGALLLSSYWLGIRFFAQKSYRANPSFQFDLSYTVTADGITIATSKGSSLVPWSQIQQVVMSNKLFTIYIAKKQAVLLPQSWFRDTEQRDAFKQALTTYLPANKIKRKLFYIF